MKRVFIFVNGILTRAGDHDGWTDRAVTWTQTRTDHKAEKWEYSTGALLRRFHQQNRAEKIATLMAYYERTGFQIVLVGHSNGCDIIARVLALRGTQNWYFQHGVGSAHLYAAAADGDDFADALERLDVHRVHLYCGGKDRALQLGRISRTTFGWAGLGYGSLGIDPEQLHASPRVFVRRFEGYGHSDFFKKGENFERTMCDLMRWDSTGYETADKISEPTNHE